MPTGFSETAVGPITAATAMALAPDGRIFVSEKTGNVRVIKNGVLLAAPFVNVDPAATDERGVMGTAFDPAFEQNQYVYVYYTAKTPTVHNRVSRFTANGDVAVPGSELVLLDIPDSTTGIHNAGAIHFGSDRKLYIAVGDDGVSSNGQSLATLRGKLLRINPDGSIPTDNPFFATASGSNRAIWALGLRNPFTFAVETGSGRIFINDVGNKTWEEIDEGASGGNFGWPVTEGPTTDSRFRSPVFAYGHGTSGTTGCAITGGDFYDAAARTFPSMYSGDYFFADYCSGWIRAFDPVSNEVRPFASGITKPVDIDVAPDGSLYYLTRGLGQQVYRVRYTESLAPVISLHPSSQTVSEGRAASFTVGASGAEPLAYQWKRNGVDIPGATSSTYTIPSVTAADDGAQFHCVVSNSFGFAVSDRATLTVTGNRPPVASITAPAAGSLYEAGQTISYSGSASDPEDGTLAASAFTWEIDLYHDDAGVHSHPVLPATSGSKSGSFTVPRVGETSPNVWYRFTLTVTDSGGLTNVTYRDVFPRTATMDFVSTPAGLEVELDGTPQRTPLSVVGVVGMTRTIGVKLSQALGSYTYDFVSWSDGGAAEHQIATPPSDTTYEAAFAARPPYVDLSAAMTASPDAPEVDVDLTYSVRVASSLRGGMAASAVVVSVALPPAASFVSASASRGSCSFSDGIVRCALGDLASGTAATLEIVVTPRAPGTLRTSVTVGSSEPDAYPEDNAADLTVTVGGAARTFGKTTAGGGAQSTTSDRKRVSRFTLGEQAGVSELVAYVDGNGSAASGSQLVRGVVYADDAGAPGALLCQTEQATIVKGRAAGWLHLPIAGSCSLAPGSYWLGHHFGSTAHVARFYSDTLTAGMRANSDSYANGPANPFGSPSTTNQSISIHAVYAGGGASNRAPTASGDELTTTAETPVRATLRGADPETCELTFTIVNPPSSGSLGPLADAPCLGGSPNSDSATFTYTPNPGFTGSDSFTFTVGDGALESAPARVSVSVAAAAARTFGNTTAGGGAQSTTSDRKRVSRFTLGEQAGVSELVAYVDGSGSAASGSQLVRGVVYADDAGAPGALLCQTEQATIVKGRAAGWLHLAIAGSCSLAPGSYWLGHHFGATAHVARFYYDTLTAGMRANSDGYANGPANPFGSASTTNQSISVYAVY